MVVLEIKISNISNVMETTKSLSYVNVFIILVLFVIFLVGVPGNALVLWVTGVKMKRRVSTVWFWNLAVADIICCSFVPLILVNNLYSNWLYGEALCKILPFILILNMFSSVFTLVAISIDQCILVVWPVWAQNHRRLRTAWIVCLVIWIVSVILGLPAGIYRTTDIENNRTVCIYMKGFMVPITLTRMVFGFLIPFVLIFTCYIRLAFKAQNIRLLKAGRKTTILAFTIIVAFFITWAPYHIMGILMLYTQDQLVVSLNAPAQALAHFNSCINPILYAFMGKDMKSKVRQSIGGLMENAFNEEVSRMVTYKRSKSSSKEHSCLDESKTKILM
ncbi:C3a anaphylatoxin chemotactic receptor-like [Aquarana catesbeiana]|uniref:C3a anaphylatoxin chemotactic receptor-like n=1 Tax=Aquarana catesbeiana TaxID=8400 RepID=UPI003CC9E8B3